MHANPERQAASLRERPFVSRTRFQHSPLSRRLLLRSAVLAAAAGILPRSKGSLRRAALAEDSGAEPTPIPGGVRNAHFFVPGRGSMVSTINDFNGRVGVADLTGTGAIFLPDGTAEQLTFRVDNRFMAGDYVGSDGQLHRGAFAEL